MPQPSSPALHLHCNSVHHPTGCTPYELQTSAVHANCTAAAVQCALAAAYQRAYALCGASSGRLSHQLCLFLLTEQPQLLAVNTDLLAGRIASLADVLGLSQPDAAELLLRSGALLDVLPLR